MPKFRKKSVVIEAVQFDGTMECALPLMKSAENIGYDSSDGGKLIISTLEGSMTASPGDWVIKGVQGEFYPCKPDIFDATYEAAD